MRISVTQIILGALIVFAACFITGWMIHRAPSQLRQPVTGNNSTLKYVDVIPENKNLFNISRYGSYFLPVLGILIIISGTVQAVRYGERNRNLALINIIAGVMVTALALITIRGGYPTTFHTAVPDADNRLMTIFGNPGRSMNGVHSITAALLLVGLGVIGVSIARLIKSKKMSS